MKIPEEGLRIWICRGTDNRSQFTDFLLDPEKCGDLTLSGHCIGAAKSGCRLLPCDAQAYRIVREKP